MISDADRRYRGSDGEVHRVSRGHEAQYGTFSGWDVYRDQVQLLTLLSPRTGSDIAQSPPYLPPSINYLTLASIWTGKFS